METLELFQSPLQHIPDPRGKKGTYRNFHTIHAVTILGLLAKNSPIDKLIRWITLHKQTLFKYFECSKPPWMAKPPNRWNEENGNPIFMLNIFAQKLKLQLLSYSVHGDVTSWNR